MSRTATERAIQDQKLALVRLMSLIDAAIDRLAALLQDEDHRVRLGAAKELADRIPALQKVSRIEEERTIRLVLGGPELQQMRQALEEDNGTPPKVIDVIPLPANGTEPIRARFLHEAIAELEAADAETS